MPWGFRLRGLHVRLAFYKSEPSKPLFLKGFFIFKELFWLTHGDNDPFISLNKMVKYSRFCKKRASISCGLFHRG